MFHLPGEKHTEGLKLECIVKFHFVMLRRIMESEESLQKYSDLRVVSKVSRMCRGAWVTGISYSRVLCLCL